MQIQKTKKAKRTPSKSKHKWGSNMAWLKHGSSMAQALLKHGSSMAQGCSATNQNVKMSCACGYHLRCSGEVHILQSQLPSRPLGPAPHILQSPLPSRPFKLGPAPHILPSQSPSMALVVMMATALSCFISLEPIKCQSLT